jgi:hypothetical protein
LSHDSIDLATDEISGEVRESLAVALGIAALDRQIPSLDIAEITQSL